MPTNRLHEIIVSLCQWAPCPEGTDEQKAQWIADRLVALVSGGHYQTLGEAKVTMTLAPEHSGVY